MCKLAIKIEKWKRNRYGFMEKNKRYLIGDRESVLEIYWNSLSDADVISVDIIDYSRHLRDSLDKFEIIK